MGDSLKDQLLALGLAKKSKPDPGRPARRKARPKNRNTASNKKDGAELSLDKAYALRRQAEKQQEDQARKRKQAEDRRRRQINNEIRKIVKQHRLNDANAEVARNFLFRERIRKIYVTPEQHKALNAGEIGLVYLSGGYHLLDRIQLDAVQSISADHLIDLAIDADEHGDEQDHPVPDDLTW